MTVLFDHDVVDRALATCFVARLSELVENASRTTKRSKNDK